MLAENLSVYAQAEHTAQVRRLSRRVMNVLDHDRVWTGPMGELAAEAAVVHCVDALITAGEQNEDLIMQHVLQTVCNGRVTPNLRLRLNQQMSSAGYAHGDAGHPG